MKRRAMVGAALSLWLSRQAVARQPQFLPPVPNGAARLPDTRVIGLISGGVDGTYVRIAADVAAVLDENTQFRVIPMLGKGSAQNIDDLMYLRGVDLAIVQSDVLVYIRSRHILPDAERKISYIAKLYDEELHILAGPDIRQLEDLAEKTVNVDVQGSGTALTAATIFDTLGISIKTSNDDQAAALDRLRRGDIAALAFVAGKPARLFSGIEAQSGLHFLAVPLTPSLLENYSPARLDHADYPLLVPENAPVETVAVGAVLATFTWPRSTDGYRRVAALVDAMFSNLARFRQPSRHPKWREASLEAQVPGWKRFLPATEWLARHERPNEQPSSRSPLSQ